MWFEGEDLSGRRYSSRRRRNKRRAPVLRVRTRSSLRKNAAGRNRLGTIVLAAAVAGVAALMIWLGLRWVGNTLFAANEAFTIKHLIIKDGPVIKADLIREYTRIRRGANLFEFDIGRIRRDFLQHVHSVRSIELTRLLPDTMKVEITERLPVARIRQRRLGDVVADRDGRVFAVNAVSRHLPTLSGYEGEKLRPGDEVAGLARDAITVLAVCRHLSVGHDLGIASIDVRGGAGGREDALELHLERGTVVSLWWNRAPRGELTPIQDLHQRLLFLRSLIRLAEKEDQPLWSVNLTLDDYRNNCPIKPRWN